MEPQQVITQFLHLPADAQRIVADLIAYLDHKIKIAAPAENYAFPAEPGGAILLPPLNLTDVPTTWPENQFMNPEFYGVWADREDMQNFDFREWRRKIWERPKSQL